MNRDRTLRSSAPCVVPRTLKPSGIANHCYWRLPVHGHGFQVTAKASSKGYRFTDLPDGMKLAALNDALILDAIAKHNQWRVHVLTPAIPAVSPQVHCDACLPHCPLLGCCDRQENVTRHMSTLSPAAINVIVQQEVERIQAYSHRILSNDEVRQSVMRQILGNTTESAQLYVPWGVPVGRRVLHAFGVRVMLSLLPFSDQQ